MKGIMKHVIFVSKSKLSQNLMTLIVRSMPRKLHFTCFDSVAAAEHQYFTKPIQLVIVDKNALQNTTQKPFSQKALKNAKTVLIHTREAHINREQLKEAGISDLLTKPFLAEELVEMIDNKLGYKE